MTQESDFVCEDMEAVSADGLISEGIKFIYDLE